MLCFPLIGYLSVCFVLCVLSCIVFVCSSLCVIVCVCFCVFLPRDVASGCFVSYGCCSVLFVDLLFCVCCFCFVLCLFWFVVFICDVFDVFGCVVEIVCYVSIVVFESFVLLCDVPGLCCVVCCFVCHVRCVCFFCFYVVCVLCVCSVLSDCGALLRFLPVIFILFDVLFLSWLPPFSCFCC